MTSQQWGASGDCGVINHLFDWLNGIMTSICRYAYWEDLYLYISKVIFGNRLSDERQLSGPQAIVEIERRALSIGIGQ